MTCSDIRDRLPLLLYGDLAGTERNAVDAHLAGCPACGKELAALRQVGRLLDEPSAALDFKAGAPATGWTPAPHPRTAQRRPPRIGRLAAMAGIAALVLIAVTRMDIRIDQRQITVRWGRSEPVSVEPREAIVRHEVIVPTALDERLTLLNELVHALAASQEDGDGQRRDEIARLREEIASMQRHSLERWKETERDVSALYTAQFGARIQGANP